MNMLLNAFVPSSVTVAKIFVNKIMRTASQNCPNVEVSCAKRCGMYIVIIWDLVPLYSWLVGPNEILCLPWLLGPMIPSQMRPLEPLGEMCLQLWARNQGSHVERIQCSRAFAWVYEESEFDHTIYFGSLHDPYELPSTLRMS